MAAKLKKQALWVQLNICAPLENAEITRFGQKAFQFGDDKVTVYYQNVTSGTGNNAAGSVL